jgi:hypothetical protein
MAGLDAQASWLPARQRSGTAMREEFCDMYFFTASRWPPWSAFWLRCKRMCRFSSAS